jgi:hypothetical protein
VNVPVDDTNPEVPELNTPPAGFAVKKEVGLFEQ